MAWLRSLLTVGALAVLAIAIAAVLAQSRSTTYPAGTSYSPQGDGAQALYLWAEQMGLRPTRARTLGFSEPPALLLVIQPELTISQAERATLDDVMQSGGTVVVAGDSFAARAYLDTLGVRLEPFPSSGGAFDPGGRALPSVHSNNRLGVDGGEALLRADDGDLLAARLPRGAGWLVPIATAAPLLDDGLRDPETARWVYERILAPLPSTAVLAFDEADHFIPDDEEAPDAGLRDLLVDTAPGRAVVVAVLLTVAWLLSSGRRLGPALPPFAPEEASRSMYEHVQALAGLYRRAGQYEAVRAHFARRYRRALARLAGPTELPPDALAADLTRRGVAPGQAARLSQAMAEVEQAHSNAQLVEAVARADAAFASLPGGGHSTLSGA